MKVLVSGAAGFIGFHLCQRLKDDFTVIGLDNISLAIMMLKKFKA